MKKCVNCKKNIRDDDVYCRNCGLLLRSNKYYILIDVVTIIISVFIIFLIALFVASYFM